MNKTDFVLMSIWLILKSLKKNYRAKKSFIADRKITDKEYDILLTFRKNLKWKQWKIITTCT